MDNRIRQIEVRDHSLIPAEAEVWISVTAEQQTPTTELRGRLMGPSCRYAGTVEVAYPLRTLPPHRVTETPGLTRRVVIPEACLWEPQCPFLYQGPIELWQDGQRRDRVALCHGLRSFHIDERGLRVNGRPLTLHGRETTTCSEEDALALHQTGYNLLIAPVAEQTLSLWEQADRLGFLMLGRVSKDDETTRRRLARLSRHASCLGWLVQGEDHPPFSLLSSAALVGLECESPPRHSTLSEVHFLFGPLNRANDGKPLLVKGDVPVETSETIVLLGGVA